MLRAQQEALSRVYFVYLMIDIMRFEKILKYHTTTNE